MQIRLSNIIAILACCASQIASAPNRFAGRPQYSANFRLPSWRYSRLCRRPVSQLRACRLALSEMRLDHRFSQEARMRDPRSIPNQGRRGATKEIRRLRAELVQVRSSLLECQSSRAHEPFHESSIESSFPEERQPAEGTPTFTGMALFRRLVSSPSPGSNTTVHSSNGHSSHDSHQQDSLLFLFNALMIGTVITHLTMLPLFSGLQQTVTLFVLGMAYSLLQEGLGVKDDLGVLGRSYTMWMNIDPHLLLFTMLPVLLTGDAMNIDTSIARRVANQCLYLASVGVLANAFLLALFVWWYLPYGWSFLLSLTLGSIFAATDPVAVVSLLKELGASPQLTVQIQGESLLNDGTSIVLYYIAYDMLKGEDYDVAEVTMFLVKTALCACGLGALIGWFFLSWVKASCNRLEHESTMIQISLTLCCAYWSYIIAEGVFHISGVLCTVCAALVLADKMWPYIVEKEAMEHVWHTFEYLGNTVIFFLAGALTGSVMHKIPLVDYAHLLVLYLMVMLVRVLLMFISKPVLRYLHPKRQSLSVAELIVMSWGGLRGAVGLALAIQVKIERAGGRLEELDANRVLFYTGGVATLTLLVNATTCPLVVRWLGITQTPWAKRRIMHCIKNQLVELSTRKPHPPAVKKVLQTLLEQVQQKVEAIVEKSAADMRRRESLKQGVNNVGRRLSTISNANLAKDLINRSDASFGLNSVDTGLLPQGPKLIQRFKDSERILRDLPAADSRIITMPDAAFQGQEEVLMKVVEEHTADPLLLRTVNESFLCLVRTQYWKAINAGEFEKTMHAEMLLNSVVGAFDGSATRLDDFEFLLKEIDLHMSHQVGQAGWMAKIAGKKASRQESRVARISGCSRASVQRPTQFEERMMAAKHAAARTQESMESVVEELTPKSRQTDSAWTVSRTNSVRHRVGRWMSVESVGQRLRNLSEGMTCIQRVVDSKFFLVTMALAISINALFMLVEELWRTSQNDGHSVWLIMEWAFLCIFFVEFLLKFAAVHCSYFLDMMNVFDFTLIILGIAGIVLEMWVAASGEYDQANVASEARIIRMTRVFRVLRILRVFRLASLFSYLKAKLKHKDYSHRIAESMQALTCFMAFVKAHVASQKELVRFLGGKEESLAIVEVARCLIESRTAVNQAYALAVLEVSKTSGETIRSMYMMRDCGHAADELVAFVMDVYHSGILNAREAEIFLHPLRHCMHEVMAKRQESIMGLQTHSGNPRRKQKMSAYGLEALDVPDCVSLEIPTRVDEMETTSRSSSSVPAAESEAIPESVYRTEESDRMTEHDCATGQNLPASVPQHLPFDRLAAKKMSLTEVHSFETNPETADGLNMPAATLISVVPVADNKSPSVCSLASPSKISADLN